MKSGANQQKNGASSKFIWLATHEHIILLYYIETRSPGSVCLRSLIIHSILTSFTIRIYLQLHR